MTTGEGGLTGDFAIVGNIVQRYAAELATLGLDQTGATIEGSPRTLVFSVFHFLNQRTGMALDISFFPARHGRCGGFNAFLIRPGNHKLSVKEYLNLHGLGEATKTFTYREPMDVRIFADIFLQSLIRLLEENLRSFLDGTAWEETPIDWMGYK
jgi:hypothetical protein